MVGSRNLEASGFFALRTPLLPRETLTWFGADLEAGCASTESGALETALARDAERLRDRLRDLVSDAVVREALFVASPSLDEAVGAWMNDTSAARARGTTEILVRYLVRMAARPTPFGLFSGCSTGFVADTTEIELGSRDAYRRHTRLDMQYLGSLCEALKSDPVLARALAVRPSSGLYEAGGQIRYAEAHTDPVTRARSYHLVSIERTEYLDATLARARQPGGATPSELVCALVDADGEIPEEEAQDFVTALTRNQMLTSDLEPPITGEEPIRQLVSTLRSSAEGEAVAHRLDHAAAALGALDAEGLGHCPTRYRAIAEALATLPAKPELARLFQVDLYKPTSKAVLGGEVLAEMKRGIELLRRISPPREDDALSRFRESFIERYDAARVPLTLALDEDAGIGFGGGVGETADPTPILKGLDFPRRPVHRAMFGRREAHLQRRIVDAERSQRLEWVLDPGDVEHLSNRAPSRLPGAFAVVATLAASSAEAAKSGEFRLLFHHVNGPSGALLLGRFCHGDATLRRAVEGHLAAEEASRPDAIFAEIVHLPEGRLGNILCRPVLRRWEIPYYGRSGAPVEQQIAVTDLLVGIEHGRVVLWSKRLDREIVPRLTTAHNWSTAALGIYRFLCALARQESADDLAWSWGPLESGPFLPRVRDGRVVLSPARWNLSKASLEALADPERPARYRAVQKLRAELKLPRWVGVVDGDNVLPVDLENVLLVESLVGLVRSRDSASLVEILDAGELVVRGPEGRFDHELVVPFVTVPAQSSRTTPTGRTSASEPSARRYTPGSEWLYAKLYGGTATADSVLKEIVAPLVEMGRTSGALSGWFFIRYADPHTHLRFRMRGDPKRLFADMLPALHERAQSLLGDGRLWRLQLDTYEREVERYGGPRGIELAERVFEADSDAVLSIVQELEGDAAEDARWRLALRGIHMLLVDLGLDMASRADLLRHLRAAFGAEHEVDVGDPNRPGPKAVRFVKGLGKKFRAERPALEALLATPAGTDHDLDPGFEILARRSERLAPVIGALRGCERAKLLTKPIDDLAASFVHMHTNRLLRAAPRAQELVLYDFLLRLSDSEAARARRR
jgi:thiopeptide-type bacteriocin biosynthesis protein